MTVSFFSRFRNLLVQDVSSDTSDLLVHVANTNLTLSNTTGMTANSNLGLYVNAPETNLTTTLTQIGNVTINGNTNVNGNSIFDGNVSINGNLSVFNYANVSVTNISSENFLTYDNYIAINQPSNITSQADYSAIWFGNSTDGLGNWTNSGIIMQIDCINSGTNSNTVMFGFSNQDPNDAARVDGPWIQPGLGNVTLAAAQGCFTNLIAGDGNFSGNVNASNVYAGLGNFTDVNAGNGNFSNVNAGNGNFSGNVTIAGNISAATGNFSSNINVTGNANVNGNVVAGGDVSGTNGNFSTVNAGSGNFTDNVIIVGDVVATNGNFSGNVNAPTGDVVAVNGNFSGNLNVPTGNVNVTTGDVSAVNGNFSGNANVTGNAIVGGDVSAVNGNFSGNGNFTGNVTVAGNVNASNGSFGNLYVGNLTFGNVADLTSENYIEVVANLSNITNNDMSCYVSCGLLSNLAGPQLILTDGSGNLFRLLVSYNTDTTSAALLFQRANPSNTATWYTLNALF